MALRRSGIYLVITVNRRTTHFELRVREPKNLKPNQFVQLISVTIDPQAWFGRMATLDLGQINPPLPVSIDVGERVIGETVSEKVVKRMKGDA